MGVDAKDGRTDRDDRDPWEDPVSRWLTDERVESCTVHEVLEKALGLAVSGVTHAEMNRASVILRRLGFVQRTTRRDGRRAWVYERKPGRPADGATKTDGTGSRWTACCGVWYSEEAWLPPQDDVERDPALAAETHRIVPEGTLNCPSCGGSLRRNEPDAVDPARVLEASDARDSASLEALYAERLRDSAEGTWLRFGPQTIPPGASQQIPVTVYEQTDGVAFLALPSDVAPRLRVMEVRSGRTGHVDGPLPGQLFAARVPADARRPIDRGGAIGKSFLALQYATVVVLENRSDEPVEVLGALFAPSRRTVEPVDAVDPRKLY